MPEKSDPREVAALDAIIAFNLVGRSPDELSDNEILAALEVYPPISEQGRRILSELGDAPFTNRQSRPTQEASSAKKEFAGMYREGSDESLDPKLKAEIEKKREEIRVRLRAKRKKDV